MIDSRTYTNSIVPVVLVADSSPAPGKLYGLFEEYCKIAQEAAQSQI